jgi:hypothetical protein
MLFVMADVVVIVERHFVLLYFRAFFLHLSNASLIKIEKEVEVDVQTIVTRTAWPASRLPSLFGFQRRRALCSHNVP